MKKLRLRKEVKALLKGIIEGLIIIPGLYLFIVYFLLGGVFEGLSILLLLLYIAYLKMEVK